MNLFKTKNSELDLAITEALQLKIMSQLEVITKFNDSFDNSEAHREIINKCVSDIKVDVLKLVERIKK